MTLTDCRSYPNIFFDDVDASEISARSGGSYRPARGQYAVVVDTGDGIFLARDPLGCNKLFYGWRDDGTLVVANRVDTALAAGIDLDRLASCPPGNRLQLKDGMASTLDAVPLSPPRPEKAFSLPTFKTAVKQTLDAAFDRLARTYPAHEVVVCLSGGLDSSVIAGMAAKRWPCVTAASFTYLSSADIAAWLQGEAAEGLAGASEDFQCAAEVAKALGITFLPVIRAADSALSAIPRAVKLCQDWRDFNVHCAIVNLFLAESIRARFAGRDVLVLTGDLMNELVCDYHAEEIDGTIYYPQPRVPITERRRFFVRGLDVNDREVGVFASFGLVLCQPFTAVADLYMAIPGETLSEPNAKLTLNEGLLDPAVVGRVSRAKQRAQVGGPDGGTLGICHRAGLSQEMLARLWTEGLPEDRRGTRPHDFVQVGRYRSTPSTGGAN